MDDLPSEATLSPIKPTTPFDDQNYVSVTIADNTRQDPGDNTTTANNDDKNNEDDVKANLFDAQDESTAEKAMAFNVDIETAPSDELMADQNEPVSLDAKKEDIGQL